MVLFLEGKCCRKSGQRVILSIVREDLSSVHDQWGLECWHAPPANVRPCFYIYVRYINKNLSLFTTSSATANEKKTEKKTALQQRGPEPSRLSDILPARKIWRSLYKKIVF